MLRRLLQNKEMRNCTVVKELKTRINQHQRQYNDDEFVWLWTPNTFSHNTCKLEAAVDTNIAYPYHILKLINIFIIYLSIPGTVNVYCAGAPAYL